MTFTRIVPLGGLGEVGMNCMALETSDGILVIDCGVTFPYDEPGVDVIHADFEYLRSRRSAVCGVVITHGHEDHIGALPYLLRHVPVPVWGPPYALQLVHARLAEHSHLPEVEFTETSPGRRFDIGPFGIEPLRVTHSIPDATALAIDTPAGRIVHTGDFKLDLDPPDGEPPDEARFRALGAEGVALLLSDSTNSDVPGRAARESDVADHLAQLVAREQGRVVVAVFASNVVRLQALFRIAEKTGRRVALFGTSVRNHVHAAEVLKRLSFPSDLLVPAHAAMTLPPRRLLGISTGTQAEPASAMSRISRGDFAHASLERGDAVIFSSRTIPGNERGVFDMICALERRGITVHVRTHEGEIHASGHAASDEQRQMLEWLRPRAFVPIHGAYHHLRVHAELARAVETPVVELIENGQTVSLRDGSLVRSDAVKHGRVHVDGQRELSDDMIAARNAMASNGVVVVTVEVDAQGTLVGLPSVTASGVPIDDDPTTIEEDAQVAIEAAIREARGPMETLSVKGVREAVRGAIRRQFHYGSKRPVVFVHVRT